jgi:hypothetical protein
MGYDINKKQQTENLKSSNESNNKEEDGENYDSDIEMQREAGQWMRPPAGLCPA